MVQPLLVVKKKECIGRSSGGITTKIHAITDSLGKPLSLMLTAGNVHDSKPACYLLGSIKADFVLADKAYNSKVIIEHINNNNSIAVIPPKTNAIKPRWYDKHIYKERHVVECFFQKIKEFRRIATRYDKLQTSFRAFIVIASCLIWIK